MSLSDNTHPDGRTYVAITNTSGWATGLDPVSAAKQAYRHGRGDTAKVIVYYAVAETFDVSMWGGLQCSDIRKGLPFPVGMFDVTTVDDGIDEDDDRYWDDDYQQPVSVTPVSEEEMKKFFDTEWEANEKNKQRLEKLLKKEEVA